MKIIKLSTKNINAVRAYPYYDPRYFYTDKDGNIRFKATGELAALVARKKEGK